MAAVDEFNRLLTRAGVIPYRKGGKVFVALDPRTPGDTLTAAVTAVQAFAGSQINAWTEPTQQQRQEWTASGLQPRLVCDEPKPKDLDLRSCPVGDLVARCSRYHFRLSSTRPGELKFEAVDGWQMADVTKHIPAWFIDACRGRREEIIEAIRSDAQHDLPTEQRPDAIAEPPTVPQ